MSGESAFVVAGAVVEVTASGLLRVELANGHQLLGHVAKRQRARVARVPVGATVMVKLSPGDLSHGQVMLNEENL